MAFISLKNVGKPVLETNIPLEARLGLDDQLLERQQRLQAGSRELCLGLARVHEEYRGRVREMVGEARYQESLPRFQELLGRFAALPERRALTPENDRQMRELRKKLAREKHEYYHGLGIDLPLVLQMRAEAKTRAREIVESSLHRELEMPSEEAPEPNPPTTRGAGVSRRTPASGIRLLPPTAPTRAARSGSRPARIPRRGRSTSIPGSSCGEQGIRLPEDRRDVRSGLLFQMPAAGLLEVWAYYQDINTDYTGFLYDESGCSDADVHQLSRLYLWTGGSTERYANAVEVRRGEDDEGEWGSYLRRRARSLRGISIRRKPTRRANGSTARSG